MFTEPNSSYLDFFVKVFLEVESFFVAVVLEVNLIEVNFAEAEMLAEDFFVLLEDFFELLDNFVELLFKFAGFNKEVFKLADFKLTALAKLFLADAVLAEANFLLAFLIAAIALSWLIAAFQS